MKSDGKDEIALMKELNGYGSSSSGYYVSLNPESAALLMICRRLDLLVAALTPVPYRNGPL